MIISFGAAYLVIEQLSLGVESEKDGTAVSKCSFITKYNQVYVDNMNLTDVVSELEEYYDIFIQYCENKNNDNDIWIEKLEDAYHDLENKLGELGSKERQKYVNFLEYLDGFATVVHLGAMDVDSFDTLMGYRFFLAINNPVIQEKELKPFAKHYKEIFVLFRDWQEYRKIVHEKESDRISDDQKRKEETILKYYDEELFGIPMNVEESNLILSKDGNTVLGRGLSFLKDAVSGENIYDLICERDDRRYQ
ncbi:MAG: hypothetical protein IJH65_08855 [Methanobrevibacter sp.]|nr:hypothetical protein [Methanobrevibacter sp.]